MLFLSPAKVLVVLVVALTVLGPDALPRVARQIGRLWTEVQRYRRVLETQVRDAFPELPPTETITQAVRSPGTFLDALGDSHTPQPESAGVPTGTRAPVEGAEAPPVVR